ncbi:hypothetical protein GGR56DRAFT_669697 [Xylariaceae sp. FL0804]|nr:hypothetical protein GGR56DRAFT_669697 [Xylariaceae sp. FL0804]
MACPKVADALAQALTAPDPAAALDSLLAGIKTLSTPATVAADLKAVVDAVFASPALGVVAQRPLMGRSLPAALAALDHDADLTVDVGGHALAALAAQPAASSFADAAAALRELVAGAHEANDDNLEAARVLADIPLDSAQRRVTNADRGRVWVRIVRNYLEAGDAVAAETYLNKLKNIIHTLHDDGSGEGSGSPVGENADLLVHFRLSQARIYDAKREFLAASAAYHDLSLAQANIGEDERLKTLAMAAHCAILAPAGPLRGRALGRLYKDERSPQLAEFGVLEKMFLDRLLAPATEVAAFAALLAPHQLATAADGSTPLDRAVVEHNLLSASLLYANAGFDELDARLGLAEGRAEATTARMIEEGRLVGRIDQLARRIWFERGVGGVEAQAAPTGQRAEVAVGRELRRWDAAVQGLAEEVENVTNLLQREFPDFVAANLVV